MAGRIAQPNVGTKPGVTFVSGIVSDHEGRYQLDTERSPGLLPTAGTAAIGT